MALTIPSLLVLGLLVAHSLRTLPRARAIAFWCSVVAYGVLRGVGLRWVMDHGVGGSFPYAIRNPLFPVFGVPLQEVTGWAIVAYLGWWIGTRFSRYVFAQIAWGCLFLGAVSWAVETAAVAAGWWHWTVPVTQPLFVNVPFIAIVDWMFVGTDFLLPFVVLTAPSLRGRPARFVALLAFPVHFGAHAVSVGALAGIPIHHLSHWILMAALLWLAMRDASTDEPFTAARAWIPIAGLAVVLADVAAIELFVVRRPELLTSIVPVIAVFTHAVRPAVGYALGGIALLLGLRLPALAVAVFPPATGALLGWGRRWRSWAPLVTVILLGVTAYAVHSAAGRREDALKRRLDAALAARDRGDLDAASRELAALVDAYPGSHVPPFLLGEIEYRTERLEEARARFSHVVDIKQDDARSYRYLAVIDRRLGRRESANRFAAEGLEIDAADPELLYLSGREQEPRDASTALALASLAFEVDDVAGAAAMLDRGLARWPEQRAFYPSRVKLALRGGDSATARRILGDWLERFPHDAEARQLSRELGMS